MTKLFTVGPVEMYPSTLKISANQVPYFRTDEFSELMLENEKIIKKLSNSTEDSRVVFLTCSGTGAMEASIDNCFDKNDRLLVINGGGFGQRFCEICSYHGIPYESVNLKVGEKLTEDHLKQFKNESFTGLLVNADETSNGQLYDLEMLSSFCKTKSMLFVVDAISSFLADEIDCSELGIDLLIVSSQKALALAPGISIVILSKKAITKCNSVHPSCYYLEFNRHLKDMERGQTPFTPAVGILIELNEMLHSIENETLKSKINHTRQLAEYFRDRIKNLPISLPDYPLSNAVTPIIIDSGAMEVYRKLKEEYDIVVTPSSGPNREKMLRVSHLGNLEKKDYDCLIEALSVILGA